jgi:hypothetical protein
MKKNTILLYLVFSWGNISAQVVWNKKLPIFNIGASLSLCASRIDGDNFLVSSGKQFIELDYEGNVSGLQDGTQLSGNPLSNYLQKRIDPTSGNPFFLMGWRNFSNSPYYLAYYKPNEGGWQSALTFGMGEVGNPLSRGPAVLELTDTSLLVFTKSFVRKIACPQDTLWIEWTKPIALAPISFPNAAVEHNGVSVFVTTGGEVSAVNADGFQIWLSTYDTFTFRGITKLGADLVACGADTSGHAVLVKLNSDGNLIWAKIFSEDLEFNALTVTQDGNLVVTGKSADGKIPLVKINQNGDLLWRKTFQIGIGATILETLDGGYFLTGGGSPSGFNGIKTNALGETAAFDDLGLLSNRNLNNGGFSMTQSPSPGLFQNGIGTDFHIPADSSTIALFSCNPWLSGVDPENNLHLSASTTAEIYNISDFEMGISNAASKDFKRLWSVTREQIASVRRDFGADGDLDIPPPLDLLTWPAKGNLYFNQNLDFSQVSSNPDSLPAPFVDANGDGVYNIFDGDYPRIKGDKMLWWAITDYAEHNESNGMPLGVDFLISAFAFDCPENKMIQQTLFVDYQVINRSGQPYSNAYLGFYTNPYLGCPEDDFIGSLPKSNSVFIYNKDAIDGEPGFSCSGNIPTFGNHVPIESITLLNQSLDHSIYFNR